MLQELKASVKWVSEIEIKRSLGKDWSRGYIVSQGCFSYFYSFGQGWR